MGTSLRPVAGTSIHQFSFVDALVVGLYDGAFTPTQLMQTGTLGLGCGDALDGELLLLDGQLLACRNDGQVVDVDASERLPFAEIVDFQPTFERELSGPLTEKAFEELVESIVPSDNLFYAVRVDGTFSRMAVREAQRQQKPYRGLAEAVGDQFESAADDTTGSLIGFKGPDVFQGLSVADFHLHYVDDARSFGGHAMDFVLSSGTIRMQAFSVFTLHLPEVESYLEAELDDIDADADIRTAESS